jgi:phosphopantetheinyl transferase
VWTGKEAILKACGIGIATGLQRATILLDGEGPRLAPLDADLELVSAWRLVAFRPAPGYVATLAVSAGVQVLRYSELLVDLTDTMPGRVITR